MKRAFKPLEYVKCYEGYRGAEKPLEFKYNGKEFLVSKILSTWVEEDLKRFFKVEDSSKNVFLLCYDEKKGKWSIVD